MKEKKIKYVSFSALITIILNVITLILWWGIFEHDAAWIKAWEFLSVIMIFLPSITKATRQNFGRYDKIFDIISIVIGAFNFYEVVFWLTDLNDWLGCLGGAFSGVTYYILSRKSTNLRKKSKNVKNNMEEFLYAPEEEFWSAIKTYSKSINSHALLEMSDTLDKNGFAFTNNHAYEDDIYDVKKSALVLDTMIFILGVFYAAIKQSGIDCINNNEKIKESLPDNALISIDSLIDSDKTKKILTNRIYDYDRVSSNNSIYCSKTGINLDCIENADSVAVTNSEKSCALLYCDYIAYFKNFNRVEEIDKLQELKQLNNIIDTEAYCNVYRAAAFYANQIFKDVKRIIDDYCSHFLYNEEKKDVKEDKCSKNDVNDEDVLDSLIDKYDSLYKDRKSISSEDLNQLIKDFMGRSNKVELLEGEYVAVFDSDESVFNGLLIVDLAEKNIRIFEVFKDFGSKIKFQYVENLDVYYLNCSITKLEIEKKISNINTFTKIEKIESLANLKTSGMITDEEYEKLKKEILDI